MDRLCETHAHADQMTAAWYLRSQLQFRTGIVPRICIGSGVLRIQALFSRKYGIPENEYKSTFDDTFAEGDIFPLGSLKVKVMHMPGHTPDHIGYVIGRNVFVGDSIFNPDIGTARTDFSGGSARQLWASIQKLLNLPSDYRLYAGHDYPPSDGCLDDKKRGPTAFCTVQEQRTLNKHLKEGIQEKDFVEYRETRDSSLSLPKLLHQALQMNIRAGRPPKQTAEGLRLLHVPLSMPKRFQ